jgi:Cholesterol oxidase, substrate-binding
MSQRWLMPAPVTTKPGQHPQDHSSPAPAGLSRRGLLAGAGVGVAAATLGWLPGVRIQAGQASTVPQPPNFPPGIPLYQQTYVNWAQQVNIPDVWTCSPESDTDVVTIVAWNGSAYALRTLERTDPAIAPFLTHLGRTFVTEATLETGANQTLQCQSRVDINVSDLFAPPGSAGGDSFASLVHGRRPGRGDLVPVHQLSMGQDLVAPAHPATRHHRGQRALRIHTRQLDHHRRIRPHLRHRRGPHVHHARVVSDFYVRYSNLVNSCQGKQQWPMNGPLEIRVTGLDDPGEAGVSGAVVPLLSAVQPRPDQPGWDVAVWIDMLTIPPTPASVSFYQEMEQWIFSHYTGSYAAVRPEWSKGWAFSGSGAWTNTTMLTSTIPAAINAGQAQDNFQVAAAAFDAADPYRIFANSFLDTLLP